MSLTEESAERLPGADTAIQTLLPLARLSGTRSDSAFRVLLDTTTRPGTVARIVDPRTLALPPVLIPVLTLANVDTNVAVVGLHQSEPWLDLICQATDARRSEFGAADIVTVVRGMAPDVLRDVRSGTAEHPEVGARVIVSCDQLRSYDPTGNSSSDVMGTVEDGPGCVLLLRGPGIQQASGLVVSGVDAAVFEQLAVVNAHHPCGVDLHLVDRSGFMASLPRSVSIDVLAPKSSVHARV